MFVKKLALFILLLELNISKTNYASGIEIILFDDRIDQLKQVGRQVKMSLQLNPTNLPCISFWEYACSKNKTAFPMIGQNLKNGIVKNLVYELMTRGGTFNAKSKVVNFFHSCKMYMNIDECYHQVFKYFKSVLAYAALNYNTNSYDRHIFETVRTRFLQALESKVEFQSMQAKKKIDAKFDAIEIRKTFLNPQKLNKEYEKFEIDGKNYFQNILNLERNINTITSDETFNTVINIGLYLHQSHNKPISYFYPSFNVHLWKDLYLERFHNETKLEKAIQCLGLPDSMEVEDKQISAAYFMAYEASWKEYMDWLDETDLNRKVNEQENRYLRDWGLSTKKLFSIIFAQSFCEMGKYSVDNIMLEGLRHSEEFASAFHCAEGSPMNPEKKCDHL